MLHTRMLKASSNEFWKMFCETSPPDVNVKDYNCPLLAPPAHKGGGSKSGKRKKKKNLSDLRKYVLQ